MPDWLIAAAGIVTIAAAAWLLRRRHSRRAAQHARLWYEDNNQGHAGGRPPDFLAKFGAPGWDAAGQRMDVYMLRLNIIDDLDDAFLTGVLQPFLARTGTALAVDATGATWLQLNGREHHLQVELSQLRRLRDLGLAVDYISLQSPLSKAPPDGEDYPMDKRIEDVLTYAGAVRGIFPGAEIGVIGALATHGGDWLDAYADLLGHGVVGYIHLDCPYEHIGVELGWPDICDIEAAVRRLGAEFGLLITTKEGGGESNEAWQAGVLASLDGCIDSGGAPRDYVIASWFPYPDRTLPVIPALIGAVRRRF